MKIISLGMGVQSTALYYMSSMGEIDRADYAIFADTGAEKSATIEYYHKLDKWQKQNNGIPIIRIVKKNILNDLLNKQNSSGTRIASLPAFSKTGMLRRQCTSEYKIYQIDKQIKEIYGLTKYARYPKTEIWFGITLDEASRMAIPQQGWKINVYPFIGYKIHRDCKQEHMGIENPVRRSELINWYDNNNIEQPVKSACYFCPFQSDKSWIDTKNNYPDDWDNAIKVDNAIRDSSKRGTRDKIYVHRSAIPLKDVKFDESQTDFWGECSGNCHI